MRAARSLLTTQSYGTAAWMGYTQPRTVNATLPISRPSSAAPKAGSSSKDTTGNRTGGSTSSRDVARSGVAALLSYCPAPVPSWGKERPTPQKESKRFHQQHAQLVAKEKADRAKRRAEAHQERQSHLREENLHRRTSVDQRRQVKSQLASQRRLEKSQDQQIIGNLIAARDERRRNLVQQQQREQMAEVERLEADKADRLARKATFSVDRRENGASQNGARHREIQARLAARLQFKAQDKLHTQSAHPHPADSMVTAQDRREQHVKSLAAKLGSEAKARELIELRALVQAERRKLAAQSTKVARCTTVNPDKIVAREYEAERKKQREADILARKQRKAALLKQKAAWAAEDEQKKNSDVEVRKLRRSAIAVTNREEKEMQNLARHLEVDARKAERVAVVQSRNQGQEERRKAHDATRGQLSKHRASVVSGEKAFLESRRKADQDRKAFAQLYRAQRYQAAKQFQQQHVEGRRQAQEKATEYKTKDYAFRKAHGKSHPVLRNHSLFSSTRGKNAPKRGANRPATRAAKQLNADIASVRSLPDY